MANLGGSSPASLPSSPGIQLPSQGQTEENKRILKELDEQKRKLKMQQQQGVPQPLASISPTPIRPGATEGLLPLSGVRQASLVQQRQALADAHANSFGFFVSQDSQFGNQILPVIPRIEPDKPVV